MINALCDAYEVYQRFKQSVYKKSCNVDVNHVVRTLVNYMLAFQINYMLAFQRLT